MTVTLCAYAAHAHDPAAVRRPGSGRGRPETSVDDPPVCAVGVGHPPARPAMPEAKCAAADEGHERAVGRQRPVGGVMETSAQREQERAPASRDGHRAKFRELAAAAGVQQRRAVWRELGLRPRVGVVGVGDLGGLAGGEIDEEEVGAGAAAVSPIGDAGAVWRPCGRLGTDRIMSHLANAGAVDAGDEDLRAPLVSAADEGEPGSIGRCCISWQTSI